MIHGIFAVRDAKAEQFTAPFQASNDAVAIRMFSELVNTRNHTFNRHPEDYQLYRIGDFDTATGELAPVPVMMVANASEWYEDPHADQLEMLNG